MGDGPFLNHPRYGFSEQQMIDEVLTDASLVSATADRAAGTRYAVALGIFTLTGGAGSVRMFIEGTLDGTNWVVLAQSTTDFSASGQAVLNAAGNSLVDLQRFAQLRTRAAITAGAPTFDLQTILTAISQDSESFLRTENFTRAGALPTSVYSDPIIRPAGTLLTNVQIVAAGVVLDGATSFDVVLQGSPDGGTNWVTIGTAAITGNGASMMSVDGEQLFSLGEYFNVRFGVVDNGVAGAAAAFDITAYMGLDSMDWIIDGDGSSGSPFDPTNVFCTVAFGAPTAEALNTRTISLQILDSNGAPINEVRTLEVILYDTSLAGNLDLANNATFSAINTGTAIAGLNTNRLLLQTDATGVADVSVLDAAVETTYITAVNPVAPAAIAQIIVEANEVALAYA